MQEVKLIIFDLDGTLVDAYTAIGESFNFVMRRLGLKTKSTGTVRRLVGWGDRNLLKPFVPAADLKNALNLYRRHHQKSLLKYSHLLPFVRRVLRKLKAKGCRLAIASNRPNKFSHILLKHLKIEHFFDDVLCADQAAHGKPHPEMLNKIVKRSGLKKAQAIYVGDMVIDAQAGRRAGISTIIVTGGSSSKAQIKKEAPFKIIASLDSLDRLV